MKCFNPKCNDNGGASWRGLCGKHYKEARLLVEGGKTTWSELERLGLSAVQTDMAGGMEAALLEAKQREAKNEYDIK